MSRGASARVREARLIGLGASNMVSAAWRVSCRGTHCTQYIVVTQLAYTHAYYISPAPPTPPPPRIALARIPVTILLPLLEQFEHVSSLGRAHVPRKARPRPARPRRRIVAEADPADAPSRPLLVLVVKQSFCTLKHVKVLIVPSRAGKPLQVRTSASHGTIHPLVD